MDDYRSNLHRQLKEEYARLRERNESKRKKVQQKVYLHLPRVAEIDQQLNTVGIAMCGEILQKKASPAQIVAKMKEQTEQLLQEKNDLLQKAGISPALLEPTYDCKICKDTGVDGIKRCSCYQRKMRTLMQKHSNLGTASFQAFDLALYGDKVDAAYGISPRENAKLLLSVAQNFANGAKDAPQNLFFYGATGLGKTFTSSCIAKTYIDRDQTVFYLSAPRLFSLFEDYKFGRDTSAKVRHTIDCVWQSDLLIIDDLGTEFRSTYVDSILFDIINSRLNNNQHTIISTNLSPSQLPDTYSERIASRICGGFELIAFLGDDIRLSTRA